MSNRKRSQPTVLDPMEELKSFGLPCHIETNFLLSRMSWPRIIQVRDDPMDKARANKYAEMLKQGVRLGRPIFTNDDWGIDCSGRYGAYEILKLQVAPEGVIVVDIPWETATQAQRDALLIVAGTLNSSGPKPLNAAETTRMIRRGLALGLTPDSLAKRFGASAVAIRNIRQETAADEKLLRTGVDYRKLGPEHTLRFKNIGVLRVFGQDKALTVLDRPYRDLAYLAIDSLATPGETGKWFTELKGLHSEISQIKQVAAWRADPDMAERIRLIGVGTPPVQPPPAGQIRRSMGAILKYESDFEALVELNPDQVEKHVDFLTRSITLLENVLRLQEAG